MTQDTKEILELLDERGDALSRDAATLIRGFLFVWNVCLACVFFGGAAILLVLLGCSSPSEPPPEPIETAKVVECAVADTVGGLIRCR